MMTDNEVRGNKLQEVIDEFRSVMSGRGGWVDSLIPPIIFVILNAITGLDIALWGALGVAVTIAVYRLFRGQRIQYALGGVGGVIVAMLITRLVGGAKGFFLPGIISGSITVLLCFITVLIKRPLVAWTSHLTRRWPIGWYWHARVRPAYSEVTLVWGLFFAMRTLVQVQLYQVGETARLGAVQLVLGWPALIVLLVASYLYGLWRLQNLNGPSVAEFKACAEPPWEGQKRGF